MTNILLTNKENCALKLVDEIILYYDARSKKHKITIKWILQKYRRRYNIKLKKIEEIIIVDDYT